jgi:peptide deformylase
MYELVEEASKVLRTPPPQFDFDNPSHDPKEISDKLIELCEQYNGIGLSANQVGLPVKCCVMMTTEGAKVFFNPELKAVSQETELEKEGCLSFPDIYVSIKRPKIVEVEYQDVNGETHSEQLQGLASRCIQHEIDHLNGIVFLQRASRLKLERALKARPKEKRKRLEYEARLKIVEEIRRRAEEAKVHQEGESVDVHSDEEPNTLPQDSSESTE